MDKSTARSRHPDSLRQAFLWTLLSSLALLLIAPALGDAQQQVVTTNITSSGLGTVVPLQPPSDGVYNITGGTRPGDGPNLFHSFGDFSVGPADIANFLNTPVNGSLPLTSNILGRVTGGNISNIYGTIQTTDFGNANLFLVNPSGIVLGPTGSVNVTGSVSFTTTQYLRLFDGVNSANFYANPANDGLANSVLAVAPMVDFGFLSPAAYGFLTAPDPSATITVQGSTLSVPSGQSISLVGGKISIQAGTLPDGTVQPAHLSAPTGKIQLASAASPGEFDVATLGALPNVDGVSGVSFTSFGSVSLAPGSSIDVSGASTVFVKGGQLVLSINDATLSTSESIAQQETISLSQGSSIMTSNSGTDPGADLQLIASNVQLDGVFILSQTTGDGPGGNITIQGRTGVGSAADSVAITNGSTINTITAGTGRGGEVQVTARTLTIENAPQPILTATVDGGGVGGDVVLNVETLSLTGGSQILSISQTPPPESGLGLGPGLGHGGNVTIQGLEGAGSAAKSVNISGDSGLLSVTVGGPGEGGRVAITSKSLTMEGALTTVSASTTGVGRAGDIVVGVQHASLSDGATIITSTASGDPNAPAGASVTVQGLQGAGSMADSVALSGLSSGIISDATGADTVRAGNVAVHAKTVSLTDAAVIQAGTPSTTAAGGNVTIDAGSVDISSGSRISSQASRSDAGQVTITANELILDNGSIESSTFSSGLGGNVVLKVGAVSLSNGAKINSITSDVGRAGDITMNVGTLSLANGSSISSASTGTDPILNPADGTTEPPGTAGNVTITATGSFTSDASNIATSAEANHGGDISITADSVQLSNGSVITANTKAPLEVTKLVLDQDGLLVSQVVGDGNAGNITAHSDSAIVINNSSMTTEATQASGGQIVITAPDIVQLINSRVSTSVKGVKDVSDGGNINIDPQFVVLQNSQILAQAIAGAGGAIDIIATSAFITDPVSIVDASSTLGISGTINIQSPLQNVGGELTALTQEFSSAAALLAQQCAARAAGGKFSTFVVAAREGLPVEPGGFLASPSWTAELFGPRLSGRDPQTQLSAVTGLFPKYDVRPIQLAKFGDSCHR